MKTLKSIAFPVTENEFIFAMKKQMGSTTKLSPQFISRPGNVACLISEHLTISM